MNLYKGIEVVGEVPSVNVYSTPQIFNSDHAKAMERQQKGMSALKNLLPQGPSSGIGDIGLSATPGAADGMYETQKALDQLLSSKRKEVLMWDLETVGTAERSRIGKSANTNFFDVTQISLHSFEYNGEGLKEAVKDPTVLSVGISDNTRHKLGAAIESLEADPNALFNFNDDMKRSLADLTLYDDTKYFGKQTINGQNVNVMTGQAAVKPSTKGTALSQKEVLNRMKMGLANLSNPELTNSQSDVFGVLENYAASNPVLAGHNVQGFDQGNMLEWMNRGGAKAPESVERMFKKEQIDTLRIARQVYNKEALETPNFQLSNIFSHVDGNGNGVAGQAHFAGADTLMNGIVLNDELSRIKKGALPGGTEQFIKQGDTFISEKGAGSFFESAFNQNKGEHDVTVRWDAKKKEWNQNYQFQESPVVGGHSYQYMGSAKDVEIGGIKHYAMVMQDLDNQTVKMIFRKDKTEITDMLTNNYTKINPNEVGTPGYLSRKEFIKEDNARRHYDSLFDPKMQNQNDTVANRLTKAYDVIDKYDAQVKNGVTGVKAIQNVQETLNSGKDQSDFYRNSYEKIEKTIGVRDRLMQEQSVWQQAIKDSTELFPLTENPIANNQSQNLFISNIQKEYEGIRPDARKDYTYQGMKVLPLASPKGEMTYLDVSSKTTLNSRLGQTLRVSKDRQRGTVMRDFENLLSQVGGTMDDATMLELKTKVQRDIRNRGSVDAGTMSFVSNRIYEAAKQSPAIVSSVPGKNIHAARTDGTSEAARYGNALSPTEDSFYKEVIGRAKERTVNSMSSETTRSNFQNFDLNNISEQASQRIKKSADITQFFDEQVTSTSGVYGLDHGQRKKKVKSLDYNQRIKETIRSFEDNNFVVNMDYLPESDDMVLFFSPKDKAPLFSNMTINEKRGHRNVHQVSIPLMNDNASVNINGTGVMMQYKAKYDKNKGLLGPNMTLENTPERAFNRMKTIPHNIMETMKTFETEGRKFDMNEVIEKQIGSYRHAVTNSQVSSSFAGDLNPENAWAASSRGKNIANGLTVDISDFGDVLLEQENPVAYREFLAWQKKEGMQGTNFITSGWNPKKEASSVRNSIMNQLTSSWNERYGNGTETGVHITRQGTNPKQWASGKGLAQDPRRMTPFGELNPATREQILKTQNYQTIRRDDLTNYMTDNLGLDKETASRRLLGGTTQISEAYENLDSVSAEKGVSGIGVRTSFMGQDEIQQSVDVAIKEVRKEIDEKTSLISTLTGQKKLDAKSELLKLEGVRDELSSGRFSVSDGQMVVPESFAKSMVSESTKSIRLKTGYQLPDAVNERILQKNNGEAFTNGILRFDNPMSFDEMGKAGMINKEGLLTVGNLVEETIKEDAAGVGSDIASNQRYRIYKDSQVVGVQRTPKGDKLILNQVQQMKNGSKVIDGIVGTRNTLSVMSDEAFERVARQNAKGKIQTIQEPINIGRNSWGGVLGTTVETTFENAMEDLDRVAGGKEASLPAVQRWMESQKDKGVTVQDLSRKEITENFVNDVFKKDLDLTGAGALINLNQDANRLVYGNMKDLYASGKNPLLGEEGQANFGNFLNKVTQDYGFDEKNAYTRVRSHAVDDYAGLSTKAKLSIREMNILQSKLTHVKEVPDGNGGMRSAISKGQDNPIFEKFNLLMDNNSSKNHKELASRIDRAQPFLGIGDDLANINQPNNIIMDMTGSFQGNANQNVMMGKNGELVFDATSLGELPSRTNRTKADMQGTMADPMSIILNNEELGISNETLGDYQKRTGGQSFLKIGEAGDVNDMGTARYKKNYIPLLGNMDDNFSAYEEVNIRDIQKHTEDIYSSAYRYNNQDYSSQNLSRDDIIAKGQVYTNRANDATDLYQQEINRYTTSSRKSGMIKGTNTVISENGMSGKAGSYNFYDTYTDAGDGTFKNAGKRRESEYFVSRKNAEASIKGIEQQIFEANGLEVGELSKKDMRKTILDKMTGTRADDDAFDVISTLNRFPSQSKGSINFMSMRVDNALDKANDNRFMISNAAADLMGADYDGDVLYSVLDLYRDAGKSAPELVKIQEAMTRERDLMENTAKQGRYQAEKGGNAFRDVLALEGKQRKAFFTDFTDNTNEAMSTIASSVKSTGIGSMDNAMVGNRDLLDYVYGEALNRGTIDATQYNQAIDSFGEVSNLTVQNFISAKKFTPENMGIDPDIFDALSGPEQDNYILDHSKKYLDTQSNLPSMLRNVNSSNVEDVMDEMRKLQIIGEGQDDLFRTGLGHVAVAQEATSNYQGVRGAAFDAGKSSGTPGSRLIDAVTTGPETVLPTSNMNRFVDARFDAASETSMNYYNSVDKTGSYIAENVAKINNRNSGVELGFGEAAETQLNNLSNLFSENHTARTNKTAGEVLSSIKVKASGVVGSNAFKVGAGFSAMWMLGSAIKSGPTPEGDEAVQEATPQEVNPAALLTSPTARVTPNGESVRLNISGSGNVNQNEVAGIVNQQVGVMTGMPMNTNVNVSDNTQELDRSFYEQAMNKILGF